MDENDAGGAIALRRIGASLEPALRALAFCQLLLVFGVIAWIVPILDPLNTYAPAAWLRGAIGDSPRIGYLGTGGKRGAFAYYSGVPAEVLEGGDAVEDFLARHPGSLVVVHVERSGDLLAPDGRFREQVVREFEAAARPKRRVENDE